MQNIKTLLFGVTKKRKLFGKGGNALRSPDVGRRNFGGNSVVLDGFANTFVEVLSSVEILNSKNAKSNPKAVPSNLDVSRVISLQGYPGCFDWELVAEASRLFDGDYYTECNADVMSCGLDPFVHYVKFGCKEGRNPSFFFSTLEYYELNNEFVSEDENAFLHWVAVGRKVGLPTKRGMVFYGADGRRLSAGLLKQARELFDEKYYVEQYPDVREAGVNPFEHFMSQGWKELRNPNRDVNMINYVKSVSSLASNSENPYLSWISDLNRSSASSDMENAVGIMDPECELVRAHFDEKFYAEQCPGTPPDTDLAKHYCDVGWRGGLDPSPNFSTNAYLSAYPDIEAAKVNPYWHYLCVGESEGRSPVGKLVKSDISDEVGVIKDYFDKEFYLNLSPELLASDDLVAHYCQYGWLEGRDPASNFSTEFYLKSNPDVKSANVNPFWHYHGTGKFEGRQPFHPHWGKIKALQALPDYQRMLRNWTSEDRSFKRCSSKALSRLLFQASGGAGLRNLVVALCHDDYRVVAGGVQLCVQIEEVAAAEINADYLCLVPLNPLPGLVPDSRGEYLVKVIFNGDLIGVCKFSVVSEVVATITDSGAGCYSKIFPVIHHLMGHQIEAVVGLVEATGASNCWLWLHDFFTLCTSFALQRNGISFCDAPNLNSGACTLCVYGEERGRQALKLEELGKKVSLHLIAPSTVAAKYWESRSGINYASLEVLPHMKLQWRKKVGISVVKGPIRIGFSGTIATHKGWPLFEKLFHKLGGSKDFEFVYLGKSDQILPGMEKCLVHVTQDSRDAMTCAVEEMRVDFILHWANWPETFSFSTYEALAGGAFVLTNKISGNVAATIRRTKKGKVFESEEDLLNFIDSGGLYELAKTRREIFSTNKVRFSYSKMTIDLLKARVN